MNIRTQGTQLEIHSPSKVNLTLELLKKRPDGFHELETVMATVSLYDQLLFTPRDDSEIQLRLMQSSNWAPAQDEIPTDHRNLVVQALQLVRETAGINLGMSVRLRKHIPSQAGLGGASGNAAAALLAANRIWNLRWPVEKLRPLAAQLGSDVPFFLTGGTAICRGRGENIEPIQCPSGHWMVIAKPPVGLSTAEVYRRCTLPHEPETANPMLSALAQADSSKIGRSMFNRLEPPATEMSPWIVRLKDVFNQLNCRGHQLSGSGSSYFGIFANLKSASLAAKCLSNLLPMVNIFTSHTLSRAQFDDPQHALAG